MRKKHNPKPFYCTGTCQKMVRGPRHTRASGLVCTICAMREELENPTELLAYLKGKFGIENDESSRTN